MSCERFGQRATGRMVVSVEVCVAAAADAGVERSETIAAGKQVAMNVLYPWRTCPGLRRGPYEVTAVNSSHMILKVIHEGVPFFRLSSSQL
jgi:hypothetical protein